VGVAIAGALVVSGIVEDAQLLRRKVIAAAHRLGIQDREVGAAIDIHLVDIRQLIALRIDLGKVRVALEKAHLRCVAHRHIVFQPRAVHALGTTHRAPQQLVPKVKALLFGQRVRLVVVPHVKLLEIVRRHKGLVAPKAVLVSHAHDDERRVRLGKGQAKVIVIHHVQLHHLAAPAEPLVRDRRDVGIVQHVLIPELDVGRGQWFTI